MSRQVIARAAALLMLLGLPGLAQEPSLVAEPVGIVQLEITGLADQQGTIHIALYDAKSSWLGDAAVLTREVEIAAARDGEVVRVEVLLPLGEYAACVFLDRNQNGKLDRNLFGIPQEPLAVSNNAAPGFGAPSYADAAFVLGLEPLLQRIIMRAP